MKSYVIQWKSTVNGRTGKGTKQFDFQEAHQLAEELNREYPRIRHEPVEAAVLPEELSASPVAELNGPDASAGPADTSERGRLVPACC